MIGWIWRMIVGRFSRCDHKWKIIQSLEYMKRSESIEGHTRRIEGMQHTLQCEKCGDLMKREI